jgi:hypothetical protein
LIARTRQEAELACKRAAEQAGPTYTLHQARTFLGTAFQDARYCNGNAFSGWFQPASEFESVKHLFEERHRLTCELYDLEDRPTEEELRIDQLIRNLGIIIKQVPTGEMVDFDRLGIYHDRIGWRMKA